MTVAPGVRFGPSRRLAAVQPPVIPIIGRWIADTPGTISLGQGIVGYGPPPAAIDAARRFGADAADHLYGPVEGEPALIDAIERKLARDNGIAAGDDIRVVATAGGNLAFMNAMLAVTDPGDEVILPSPYYFNHEMAIVMAGARPVAVPMRADHQLDVDAIAAAMTPQTRAVVTVSPNNPTGAVYAGPDLAAVNRLCGARGVFHVHDEAYEYFVYDGATHVSPGSRTDARAHTISLFSLSKAYGMASWRMGYMVIPVALQDAVSKIQDTILICPPGPSQKAATVALGVGRSWTARHLPAIARARRVLLDALSAPGVPCEVSPPGGALFLFVRARTSLDALAVTERLTAAHRVAVVPGSAFGARNGCWLRVSFGAADEATVAEGSGRLVTGLGAIAREHPENA
ncbi:MAG TPA: pyridoxal phosphate-dependent aminotransferase [Vicinamibacterales bacterium]|nr:pyridoxal phosphate-dependent aminotransferase [Vicinamibacterales bacterium]